MNERNPIVHRMNERMALVHTVNVARSPHEQKVLTLMLTYPKVLTQTQEGTVRRLRRRVMPPVQTFLKVKVQIQVKVKTV